jgi:hypothetical protein
MRSLRISRIHAGECQSVGDLLTQHLDEWEQEAERKGGVLQALTDHFTKVFEAPFTVGHR